MSVLDWIIMIATLLGIMVYGLYKSKNQSAQDFLLAGRQMPWYVVMIGIMATQASAITFISGPGQAFSDGMRFVQYYFGLPLAMIVVAAVFVPAFQRVQAQTAYDFLDKRFDRKTRLFTGMLFLFSRGVSTGMSIFAPAIVLSSIFGWNIYLMNILCGGLLIIYTFTGGAKAIAHTQKIQFSIILASMAVAGYMVVKLLPANYAFGDALFIAGEANKLNIITTDFDWNDKYNIYSGIIGGFFLALSYFGTDQSQVGRYLTAKSERESKLGLLLNGFIKIPMQFFILLIGVLLYAFFSLHKGPIFYNQHAVTKVAEQFPSEYKDIMQQYDANSIQHQQNTITLLEAHKSQQTDLSLERNNFLNSKQAIETNQADFRKIISDNATRIGAAANDTNYVFLHFVKNHLPAGLIGLIFAIVFLASWGSISAALHSLASSTLLDFHLLIKPQALTDSKQLWWLRMYTLFWGAFGIVIAMFATRMKSLIEAVNELGSLFYGPILGIFLVAFFAKKIKGNAVFIGAILAELLVLIFYKFEWVAFLWLNVVGALAVIFFSWIIQVFKLGSPNQSA